MLTSIVGPVPEGKRPDFSRLSPLLVREVRDILAEINKAGVSILLVEHNLKVAMSLADRVYLMGKAHIGFAGTIEELNAAPQAREKYLEV